MAFATPAAFGDAQPSASAVGFSGSASGGSAGEKQDRVSAESVLKK
jgi:hypothetical protein